MYVYACACECQARDRALLAIADDTIRERERGTGMGESEAGADLHTRRLAFFISSGVGLPALTAALARSASGMGKSRDEYVAFLLEAPDLIEELRRAAHLTACAPRVAVREQDVSLTGSRGEQLLGGTERARAKVLGSEFDQAVRAFKRCQADLELKRARMEDLKARKDATERLAREHALLGEAAEAEAEESGPAQPARRKKRAEPVEAADKAAKRARLMAELAELDAS